MVQLSRLVVLEAAALQQRLQADLLVRLQTRTPPGGAGGILPLSSVLVLMAGLPGP